jgi:hypothetical protein
MKKNIFIISFFCYISTYAQGSVDTNDILTALKKDYLYNLVQINTNANTILTFKKTTEEDREDKCLLIEKKLKLDLQIKSADNIWLQIQEDCNSEAITANVLFILLKDTKRFIKKNGNGEFVPNKAIFTYKWVLKGDLLIFIFTDRPLNYKFQQYVYLPTVE